MSYSPDPSGHAANHGGQMVPFDGGLHQSDIGSINTSMLSYAPHNGTYTVEENDSPRQAGWDMGSALQSATNYLQNIFATGDALAVTDNNVQWLAYVSDRRISELATDASALQKDQVRCQQVIGAMANEMVTRFHEVKGVLEMDKQETERRQGLLLSIFQRGIENVSRDNVQAIQMTNTVQEVRSSNLQANFQEFLGMSNKRLNEVEEDQIKDRRDALETRHSLSNLRKQVDFNETKLTHWGENSINLSQEVLKVNSELAQLDDAKRHLDAKVDHNARQINELKAGLEQVKDSPFILASIKDSLEKAVKDQSRLQKELNDIKEKKANLSALTQYATVLQLQETIKVLQRELESKQSEMDAANNRILNKLTANAEEWQGNVNTKFGVLESERRAMRERVVKLEAQHADANNQALRASSLNLQTVPMERYVSEMQAFNQRIEKLEREHAAQRLELHQVKQENTARLSQQEVQASLPLSRQTGDLLVGRRTDSEINVLDPSVEVRVDTHSPAFIGVFDATTEAAMRKIIVAKEAGESYVPIRFWFPMQLQYGRVQDKQTQALLRYIANTFIQYGRFCEAGMKFPDDVVKEIENKFQNKGSTSEFAELINKKDPVVMSMVIAAYYSSSKAVGATREAMAMLWRATMDPEIHGQAVSVEEFFQQVSKPNTPVTSHITGRTAALPRSPLSF